MRILHPIERRIWGDSEERAAGIREMQETLYGRTHLTHLTFLHCENAQRRKVKQMQPM